MGTCAVGYIYADSALPSESEQRVSIERCCTAFGVRLESVFVDVAPEKKGLQSVIARAKVRELSFVVAACPETIDSDAGRFCKYSLELSERNVRLVFAANSGRPTTLSPRHIEKIVASQKRNAALGFFGSVAPFGYSVGKLPLSSPSGNRNVLLIFEPEANLVRRIFELSVHGEGGHVLGCKAIATLLNAANLTYRNGKPWNADRVYNVVRDETYKGPFHSYKRYPRSNTLRPRDQWVTTAVPQIVEADPWDAAQKPFWTRESECAKRFAERPSDA